MKQQQLPVPETAADQQLTTRGLGRRRFLLQAAGVASVAAIAGACHKSSDDSGINLGSGDVGILNYAYALEQLEAAFYTAAVAAPYNGITTSEQALLTDIRDHEIAHREFFKTALGANAIVSLEVNFSSINFTSRDSVLSAAKAFEDLGVSAYNGAGRLITSTDYLLLAGKIVSVEARHAGYIRDLISNGSFADNTIVAASTGLDQARMPNDVLAIASTYLKSKLNASNLPTS